MAIALALTQCHCRVVEGAGKENERMFSWLSLSRTYLKTVFFCKNDQSYKENKKWRSSVYVQLNSMCTDICQLMN